MSPALARPIGADAYAPEHAPFPAWPVFGLEEDVRPALAAAADRGEPVALATLWRAEGGAPRGVGAQMAITASGLSGYLSGGCIEADVALHGRAALADGQPRRLVYGRGGPPDMRLPCGGRIEVLVEAIAPGDPALARLRRHTVERRPCAWVTDGRRRACLAAGEPAPFSLALTTSDDLVRRSYLPTPRLILLGSEPIALALASLASAAGMQAVLVRPKGPSQPPPVPVASYCAESVPTLLERSPPDAWTAVAALSHELDLDHQLLCAALASSAFYVGALGSRRRLDDRRRRLSEAGLSEAQIARLRAPIGLEIGARSAWEIAFAVMAEIVESLPRAA
jgi:xanthine dehydrogenase accessory factor